MEAILAASLGAVALVALWFASRPQPFKPSEPPPWTWSIHKTKTKKIGGRR